MRSHPRRFQCETLTHATQRTGVMQEGGCGWIQRSNYTMASGGLVCRAKDGVRQVWIKKHSIVKHIQIRIQLKFIETLIPWSDQSFGGDIFHKHQIKSLDCFRKNLVFAADMKEKPVSQRCVIRKDNKVLTADLNANTQRGYSSCQHQMQQLLKIAPLTPDPHTIIMQSSTKQHSP